MGNKKVRTFASAFRATALTAQRKEFFEQDYIRQIGSTRSGCEYTSQPGKMTNRHIQNLKSVLDHSDRTPAMSGGFLRYIYTMESLILAQDER